MDLQELKNHAHATIDKLIDETMKQTRQSIATEARGVLDHILGPSHVITGSNEDLAEGVRVFEALTEAKKDLRKGGRVAGRGRRKKKDGRSGPRTPKQIAAARRNVKHAHAARRKKSKDAKKGIKGRA